MSKPINMQMHGHCDHLARKKGREEGGVLEWYLDANLRHSQFLSADTYLLKDLLKIVVARTLMKVMNNVNRLMKKDIS